MSFIVHLEEIEDNRKDTNKDYDLVDITFLTMASVLSGAEDWKAIHLFDEAKLE